MLEEILVKSYARGFSITEVPFTYFPRGQGTSHARLIRFGTDLALSALKLWRFLRGEGSLTSVEWRITVAVNQSECRLFYDPNRLRYSLDLMNALTISDF